MTTASADLIAEMLLEQERWLIRRKLSIRLIDYFWHRRHLTVDYDTSWDFIQNSVKRHEMTRIPLPVSLLEKAPVASMAYDLEDAGGVRLSLPSHGESLETGREVLMALADRVFETNTRQTLDKRIQAIAAVVNNPGPEERERVEATVALRYLRGLPELWKGPNEMSTFIWLATALLERTLLVVDRPVTPVRDLVKLSFTASHVRDKVKDPARPESIARLNPARAGLKPYPFSLQLSAWRSRSVHIELESPLGLEILRASVKGIDEDEMQGEAETTRAEVTRFEAGTSAPKEVSDTGPPSLTFVQPTRMQAARGPRSHLYVPNPDAALRMDLNVDFRVARSGFVSAAAWITAVIAGVLVTVTVALPSFRDHADAGGALLLAFPALGAAVVTQYGAHTVTSMMLTTVRRAVYVSSILAFGACVLLLIDDTTPKNTHKHGWWHSVVALLSDRWPWAVLSVLAIWLALLAYLARQLPAVTEHVRPTHRLIERLTRALVPLLTWPRIGPL